MSCGPVINLGVFTQGEKPAPLQYTFLDADGVPINLTGYTVRFTFSPAGGAPTTANGSLVNATGGVVQYVWTGPEFATTGKWRAEFIVGNGTNRFISSLITYTVRAPVGPVPII